MIKTTVRMYGQLVTQSSCQSTHHTIFGCDELTVWRVDWHPFKWTPLPPDSFHVIRKLMLNVTCSSDLYGWRCGFGCGQQHLSWAEAWKCHTRPPSPTADDSLTVSSVQVIKPPVLLSGTTASNCCYWCSQPGVSIGGVDATCVQLGLGKNSLRYMGLSHT